MKAASFRRTLFLTRVPKGTGRFLMMRLACLIYFAFYLKKRYIGPISNAYMTSNLVSPAPNLMELAMS
jgi:hypothetical protein